MEAVFLKLVNMSITASWLILAVVVLRLLLKKAPKALGQILWGLVGIRLICPAFLESGLSLVPSAETLPEDIIYTAAPAIQSGVPVLNYTINPILAERLTPDLGASANPTQIWSFILSRVWLAGAAVILLYGLIGFLRLRRRVSAAALLRDNLWICDEINTPFILGIFRPRVYLPSAMAEAALPYVAAHENAHLQRGDHWWKLIGFLLLAVYWFNPLVWAAYLLLCRDIELACDEKVIQNLDMDGKKAYAEALFACSVSHRGIAACPLAFGEVGVKERIQRVLKYRKPAFWGILLAVAACVVLAVCFLTNPVGRPEAAKVVGEYDISTLGGAFLRSGEPAYAVGANLYGKPVFQDPDAAFAAMCTDYAGALWEIEKQFLLLPVTTTNYEPYKTYGWQVVTDDESLRADCAAVSLFFDIYENSFQADGA